MGFCFNLKISYECGQECTKLAPSLIPDCNASTTKRRGGQRGRRQVAAIPSVTQCRQPSRALRGLGTACILCTRPPLSQALLGESGTVLCVCVYHARTTVVLEHHTSASLGPRLSVPNFSEIWLQLLLFTLRALTLPTTGRRMHTNSVTANTTQGPTTGRNNSQPRIPYGSSFASTP